MQITRQADYAIRAVRFLARKYGSTERIATKTVAREMKIPPSFLAKIISQLSIKGLLLTSRGAHGGVMLKIMPRKISLLDVVEAIDGPIQLNECVGDPTNCTQSDECPMHTVWMDTQKDLVTRLRLTTFDTLI